MPPLIDASGSPSRSIPRKLIVLVILVVAAIAALSIGPSIFVDLLWFRTLGFGSVYTRTLAMQATMVLAAAVATWAILAFALSTLRKSASQSFTGTRSILLNGQPVQLKIGSILKFITIALPILVALPVASSASDDWPIFALFMHAPRDTSFVDPILNRPLSFYLFTLPAWQILAGWILLLAIIIAAATVVFTVISSGAQALDKSHPASTPPARNISIAAAILLIAIAAETYVGRFDVLTTSHTIFTGATYTDAHIYLPGSILICLALLLGAALALINAFRAPTLRRIFIAFAPAIVCFLGVNLVSAYVGSFIVKPNELTKERSFIAANIDATRSAFGLDRFQQQEFPAETTIAASDPAHNQATLQNIRLWDWHALQDTLRQNQEIRTYYDFPDIDIDRYSLNGNTQEVMLAARELNVEKLPESSRNWINERLIYTHGYGVTMNTVNGFTPEGLPNLLLSNMPVQSTVAGLNVSRPEVYFGLLTDTDVYVKTHQQEFDYPQGQNNT
ncbi:MAG: UPF0182 family protein, partial [Acidobacteriota bacterium]